jgi:multidrug efflux pump
MSHFFIHRPIFASVIAILIVIAGLVAAKLLPLAQYPEITPPTVQISTVFPGASAETLAKTVAAPIEEQLAGVENLLYFSSTAASSGEISVTATFDVGTDIDKAIFNVNNRVQLALPRLPDEVRRNGVVVQKRATGFLMLITLTSSNPKHDTIYLSNYKILNVDEEIKRIPGVADSFNFNDLSYSMRIWLNPDRMARLGVTPSDVASALRAQNAQYAAGKIGAEPAPPGQALTYTVTTSGRLADPEQFGDIVIRSGGPNGVLRLKDIARIELGAKNYGVQVIMEHQSVTGGPIILQTGANALAVGKAVKAKLAELKKNFPEGMDYTIPYDSTEFVVASIDEVTKTLAEAALLVVIVVFVFLQHWRATLIPMIAVPVSLIGTFAGLWLFGFTINTLTLFALVLAIGIVVDDAIVVMENVERLMREQGLRAFDASVQAMKEVSGAVVAIVLVLCAVFVPVAFLGGITGQLYRQFAVTVAIAVVISGFTALTLTPALCALLLKPGEHESRLFHPFNTAFARISGLFLRYVDRALNRRRLTLGLFAGLIAVSGLLFWRVPGGFVPVEDQGALFGIMMLPDGASLQRTIKTGHAFVEKFKGDPAIEHIFVVGGVDNVSGTNKPNSATTVVRMKSWSKRDISAHEYVKKASAHGMTLSDGLVLLFEPPAIYGLGSSGGYEFYLQSRLDANPKHLDQVSKQFLADLAKNPRLQGNNSFYRASSPQLHAELNREKAMALGVPVNEVFDALQSTLGTLYVNDFNKFGRAYRVQLQADANYRARPEDLGNVHVRSATTGLMIPLKALLDIQLVTGPEQIDRYNGFIGAKFIGSAAPGTSSSEALGIVEKIARDTLPPGYRIEWSGQAFQEKRASGSSLFAFGLGVLMVYLILAALYERWRLPLAVVTAVPFALLGALGFVWLRGMQNDIYFQIGLVVLIGLAAKNAILIVEFAHQGVQKGMSPVEAALEAARLRFRPIVMTSLAFMLGVLPLAFSSGAGAAARQSMGSGVFGGMLVATFVAPIFVPLFFVLVTRRKEPK